MSQEQISARLFEAMQQNAQLFSSLSDEVKAQLKTLIDAQVENLGLVTREEFESLRISLNRALSRIEELESQLGIKEVQETKDSQDG